MCGRFVQANEAERYATLLNAQSLQGLPPRYNVAPSLPVMAVKETLWQERVLVTMRWGLIPHWAKTAKSRYSMINARAETIADKPAYRDAFRHHRCLIPVDGFYEWHAADGKQPYYVHRHDGEPLVLAGIWDHWDDPAGGHIDSCSIVVTAADEQMSPIHERMPLILPPSSWASWLDTNLNDRVVLEQLMAEATAPPLEIYPISRRVNSPRNEGVELIRPED